MTHPSYTDHGPIPYQPMSNETDIDIRKFLLVLWRRKITILLTMLIFISLVYMLTNRITPQYGAEASVLIQSNINPSGELRSFVSSIRIDNSIVLSEAEVLKSRSIARQVILDLNLINDPEFNPNLKQTQTLLSSLLNGQKKETRQDNFKMLSVDESKTGLNQSEISQTLELVIDQFVERIRVRPVPGSFVLQIEFSSKDPVKAALITNKILDAYIAQNMNLKLRTTQRITNWLDNRLNTLRNQVRDTEEALEEFRRQYDVEVIDIDDFSQAQISGLNNQLVLAKAKEAQARARLAQIQNWMKDPSKIQMTDEAVNSRVLQSVKLKEADQIKTVAELSSRYGPKHPTMMDAELALAETREQMRQELRNIAKNIQSNLDIAQRQVAEMGDVIDNTTSMNSDPQAQENMGRGPEGDMLSDIEIAVRMRELVREKESSEAILENFMQTYKRAADQGQLQESQARIISYATKPATPYYPNKPLFISLSIVASFFMGLALSLLLEKLVNAYRTVEELERDTGQNCLGLVPAIDVYDTNKPIADYILNKDGSRVAESVRTLRMVLNLRAKSHDQKSQVVAITSSLQDEGKTTLSAWMARTSAKSGERVIIIDCDLRRPRLHDAFGKAPQNTLIEYLTGKCTLEEALYRDPGTNMHAIFARAVPNNALDLLSKDRMHNLIEALKEQYDLIILDCPACLSVSDSRLLASKADQTVFAVAWNDTPREVVNAGIKQFADFGYDALNLVLTHVDLKKYAKYGFNDALHYYSAYNPYYQD